MLHLLLLLFLLIHGLFSAPLRFWYSFFALINSDCFAQKSVRKLDRKINSCEVDLIAMSSNTIFSRNFKGFAEIGLEIYHGIREVLLIF